MSSQKPPPFLHPWEFYSYHILESTMIEAQKIWEEKPGSYYVVQAQQQTAGRGRYDRSWFSPLGNLYVTLGVPYQGTEAPLITYVAAISVREALAAFLPEAASLTLKWPNDVLIAEKKVGGILIERVQKANQAALLIGIGLNLVSHPEGTRYPATDILQETGMRLLSDLFLPAFLICFEKWFAEFNHHGFSRIREIWLAYRSAAHSRLTVRSVEGGQEVLYQGKFEGLDDQGHLILRLNESGILTSFRAGDVTFG